MEALTALNVMKEKRILAKKVKIWERKKRLKEELINQMNKKILADM